MNKQTKETTQEHPPRPNWTSRELAIILTLGLLILAVAIDYFVDEHFTFKNFIADLPSDIVGALIVFWLFDWAYNKRQQQESETQELEDLKTQLIEKMGSQVHDEAIHAVEQLRKYKWLDDGSLQGKDFWKANLQGAELDGANLKNIAFPSANLCQARLADCDMQNIWASAADFRESKLWRSNLQQANLAESDFQDAQLVGADLRGTKLSLANLQEANLNLVKYDTITTLPDDTNWSPNTDMTRFTNPEHPHFWRPKPGGVWWYPKK